MGTPTGFDPFERHSANHFGQPYANGCCPLDPYSEAANERRPAVCMSTYNDGYNDHAPRASVTVHTDTPEAKVTYRGDDGAKFRVIVRQKPNPIGFSARLPGDKR